MKIKNRYPHPLRLSEFGITIKPGEVKEINGTEAQLNAVRNTHELEIIEEEKTSEKKKR